MIFVQILIYKYVVEGTLTNSVNNVIMMVFRM